MQQYNAPEYIDVLFWLVHFGRVLFHFLSVCLYQQIQNQSYYKRGLDLSFYAVYVVLAVSEEV